MANFSLKPADLVIAGRPVHYAWRRAVGGPIFVSVCTENVGDLVGRSLRIVGHDLSENRAIRSAEKIEGTRDPLYELPAHAEIAGGHSDVAMSEENLHHTKIHAELHEMGCERVPQDVGSYPFPEPRVGRSAMQRLSDSLIADRVCRGPSGKEKLAATLTSPVLTEGG